MPRDLAISPIPVYRGRLGLRSCPGWPRGIAPPDLEAEVRAIADWPAAVVVTLMQSSELRLLGLDRLPRLFEAHIPVWMHLPIRDHGVPDAEWMGAWPRALQIITGHLQAGDNVVVHCLGGLGRTGMVAAMCLMEAESCDGAEAIRRVREAHSVYAVETPEQRAFVRSYRPILRAQ